jgi:four helix bundle protein
MRDFRQLQVWEKAHEMTLAVYSSTSSFPKDEMYGLTSQLRRSAASVASNIAEGCGREGDAEFRRFLQIAMGSASEADYQILLAHDLGFLSSESHAALLARATEVKRMLATLIRRLKTN